MIARTIKFIHDKPLSKIVSSIVVKTMILEHLELTLNEPIDKKVDKLTEIITALCKMLNHLKEDIKPLKTNTHRLLVGYKQKGERKS